MSVDAVAHQGESPLTLLAPERSEVLNVLLHCAYDLCCDTYSPSLQCVDASFQAMHKYGLTPLQQFICPGRAIYNTLLNRVPFSPLEVYALAAANDLADLAVVASSYTLHLKLHSAVTPELAHRIGPGYLARLYQLHGLRMATLKKLLDLAIFPHVPNSHCSAEQRQIVNRAYRLAVTQVYFNATPGTCEQHSIGMFLLSLDLLRSAFTNRNRADYGKPG